MQKVGEKVLKVISAVNGKVAKSGYNSFQKYNYVMEKDLLEAVREELVKNKLLVTMSVESVERNADLTTVRTKHTILDCDSGEFIEVWSAGEGKDSTKDEVGGDKACPKAITSASKYFWLKFFLLSGNDDPENDSSHKPAPGKAEAPKVVQKATGGFLSKKTDVKAEAKKEVAKPIFGVKKSSAVAVAEVVEQEETEEEQTEDPGFGD